MKLGSTKRCNYVVVRKFRYVMWRGVRERVRYLVKSERRGSRCGVLVRRRLLVCSFVSFFS